MKLLSKKLAGKTLSQAGQIQLGREKTMIIICTFYGKG